jgi:hypothetical protein
MPAAAVPSQKPMMTRDAGMRGCLQAAPRFKIPYVGHASLFLKVKVRSCYMAANCMSLKQTLQQASKF